MIRIAELTVDEKWALTKHIKHSQIILVRQKAQAIMFASSSVGTETISLGIGKNARTITEWLKDWNEQKLASLFSRHQGNSNASKLTPSQKEQIKQVLQDAPRTQGLPKEFWDVPTLKKYIRAEFGVVYECPQSYHFLLKYSNLSFKYPDTFDLKRDEVKIKERVQEIHDETKLFLRDSGWELFCADEVRIEQEAEIRKAWLKRGERTIVKVNRKKESQNYIGFLSQKNYRCFLYKLDWQKSEEILKAMKRLLSTPELHDKHIAIIWDNVAFHRSKLIKEALKKGNLLERVHLISMPPYAPDENPIEHVWNTAKKHQANIQHDTFAETKTRFENFVRNKTFKYSFRGVNRQHLR